MAEVSLDTVGVLHIHLVEMERTLSHVVGHLAAEDLAHVHKNMGMTTRTTALTQSAERDLERIRGYLDESNEG